MELYKKYRPKDFSGMVGQDGAVKVLSKMVADKKVPHAIMFTGPSGTGKTTAARILKSKLKCGDLDYCEMNCSDVRGIDAVRDIRGRVGLAPMSGKARVWVIDEAHGLTKDAQDAFLKLLEDTPRHVYFMLCTTNPNKLLATVRNRCTEITMRPLTPALLKKLLWDISCKEKTGDGGPAEDVIDKIVDASDGSARKALVLLEQVMQLDDEDEQMAVIQSAFAERSAIEICRGLIAPRPDTAKILKLLSVVEEEPESVRRMILGYFAKVLMGGGKFAKRAAEVIDCCQDNVYDSGKAGLALQIYRACGN